MTTWLVITRAVHFGACLFLFGLHAFECFVASSLVRRESAIGAYWKTRPGRFNLVLLPVVFVSGTAWFVLVAMTMSGQQFQMDILKIVWTQTEFGTVWKIRLLLFLMATIAAGVFCFLKSYTTLRSLLLWFQLVVNGCLLGSLAWAGHGQESSHWHLFADVLHLLGAGVWPAGLLPMFLLLRKSRRLAVASDWLFMAALVSRFSAISLAAVSLLTATGLVNSWFLVGSVADLFSQPYGRWLLAKIIFFGAAVAIASVNLSRLKPRMHVESSQPERAGATVAQLQTNVQSELFLGLAIVIIVAILGILPPAIH